MVLHAEINPSPEGLPLSIASAALRAARSSKTSHSGSAYFETGTTADGAGVGIITGPAAAEHGGIGRIDEDGTLRPLVDIEPVKLAAQAAQQQAEQVRENAEKEAQALREQMSKIATSADETMSKATELAQSALDTANKADDKATTITTTVNGQESKFAELSASLESTSKTASDALEQTAKVKMGVSELNTTLRRDYLSVEESDKKYAEKYELTQTAEGLESKISKAVSDADTAVTTANAAKQTADSNAATITQVSQTAQGAVDRVSAVEQSLDGFKTTVSETYQPKGDYATNGEVADTYATKSALDQTSTTITSRVSETAKTAQSALEKASAVEQTAGGLATRISEVSESAQGAVTTANEAKQTADSNATAISQMSDTARGALEKASNVEQSLDGFKTTVSQTYQPKGDYATNGEVADTYATKTSVEQTAEGIVSEVAESYQAKGDYATKTELSQTSTSLSARISSAQTTANTANSTANGAKSQANNLDTLIRMDTNGVRVGKIVSGTYRGYSCLMNANGSFDVIDDKNNIVARLDTNTVTLAGGVFNVGVLGSQDLYIGAEPLNRQQYENGLVINKNGQIILTAGARTMVHSPQGEVSISGRKVSIDALGDGVQVNCSRFVVNGTAWDSVTRMNFGTNNNRRQYQIGTFTNPDHVKRITGKVKLTSGTVAPLPFIHPEYLQRSVGVSIQPSGAVYILVGPDVNVSGGTVEIYY